MEKLVGVNVGSIQLFKAFVISSCIDVGIDAMGCVREQEFS